MPATALRSLRRPRTARRTPGKSCASTRMDAGRPASIRATPSLTAVAHKDAGSRHSAGRAGGEHAVPPQAAAPTVCMLEMQYSTMTSVHARHAPRPPHGRRALHGARVRFRRRGTRLSGSGMLIHRVDGNATIGACGCHRRRSRWPVPPASIEAGLVGIPGRARRVLRLELRADLATLVLGTVHVDVKIAGLESRILLVGQLRALGHRP
jgi:hypothetical protein